MNSYIAADIAEFIRQELLTEGLSFSFETVTSDLSKVDFLNLAKKKGYRIYLYYFSTEDPLINRSRVNVRVLQKGHAVSEEMIQAVSSHIQVPLIVGGGITDPEKAAAACRAGADLVVVGNAIEKDPALISSISEAVHRHNRT